MDCLDKILEYYNICENYNSEPTKIWLAGVINKLMIDLKKSRDYSKIKNCLILLINLFFGIENPDHLHSKGKSIDSLSKKDKKILKKILEEEFNKL
ncbi:MAG: hypothetical protein ACP6IY_16600 [Promethearchaeia archaeon]